MSTGSKPLTSTGSLILLTEESKTAIYSRMRRKEAFAAGIEALVLRAMETGETLELEYIADLAGAIKTEMAQLAITVLQLNTSKA